MPDALEVVDGMIEEALAQKRQMSKPRLGGGGNVAPFDGEVLGTWIRYVILNEVRCAITGEEIDPAAVKARFHEQAKVTT